MEIVEKGEDKAAQKKYLEYLESLGFAKYDTVFYFDFMSRGTCQSLLEHRASIFRKVSAELLLKI